jgi:hypothetical protein
MENHLKNLNDRFDSIDNYSIILINKYKSLTNQPSYLRFFIQSILLIGIVIGLVVFFNSDDKMLVRLETIIKYFQENVLIFKKCIKILNTSIMVSIIIKLSFRD